jgi:hypothetical protein
MSQVSLAQVILLAQVTFGNGSLLAMGPGGGRNVPETRGSIKPESGLIWPHGMPLRGS